MQKITSQLITIGSRVRIRLHGKIRIVEIVNLKEADIPRGKISFYSSLGLALLGKNKNDRFIILTNTGEQIGGSIIDILK